MMDMTRKCASPDNTFPAYPQELRTRINFDKLEEVDIAVLLEERMGVLFGYFGISRDDPLAYEKLAKALAFRHVEAFQESLEKVSNSKGTGGPKPQIGDKEPLMRLMSEKLTQGKSVAAAALALVKKDQAYFGFKFETLANIYRKEQSERRNKINIEFNEPMSLCRRRKNSPCFDQTTFDTTDADELSELCSGSKNCTYRKKIDAFLTSPNVPSMTIAHQHNWRARLKLRHLRRWAWPSIKESR